MAPYIVLQVAAERIRSMFRSIYHIHANVCCQIFSVFLLSSHLSKKRLGSLTANEDRKQAKPFSGLLFLCQVFKINCSKM